MSILTLTPTLARPGGEASYEIGYLEGRLAAVDKTPSSVVMSRAAAADQYDPPWAQGYDDGYLHQIDVNAALREKQGTDQ